MKEINKLHKRATLRRGELRTYLEREDLTSLLGPESPIPHMHPKTRLSTIRSHQRILEDKYGFYNDCVEELPGLRRNDS